MSEHLVIADQPEEPEGSRFGRAHHVLIFFVLATLAIWLLTGFYQVKVDQVAIVERLGEYVSNADGTAILLEHGLHYHVPWPIDRVHIVSVQQIMKLDVKTFNASPKEYDQFKQEMLHAGYPLAMLTALYDPYLITADKSVVHVEISALYRINRPEDWLNTVSHESSDEGSSNDMRDKLLQQIAQRAIVSQVAKMPLDKVLLSGRDELQRAMTTLLQSGMDLTNPSDPTGKSHVNLGIQIESVSISQIRPPDAVKPAFEEVLNQRSLRDTVITSAEAQAKAAVTSAETDSRNLETNAQTYQQRMRQEAKGEADRFREILVQYTLNPVLTRWNLFSDAVKSVSSAARRIYFVQPGQRTFIQVDPPQNDAGQPAARP